MISTNMATVVSPRMATIPPPHPPVPRRNISVRTVILRFGTPILSLLIRLFRIVILRFGTPIPPPLIHPFRAVILRFGTNISQLLTHPFRIVILRFGTANFDKTGLYYGKLFAIRRRDLHGHFPFSALSVSLCLCVRLRRGTLSLKNAVESSLLISISHKEHKDHKGGMFLLIISAALSVRQFTQLVKTKNRRQVWIIHNTRPL